MTRHVSPEAVHTHTHTHTSNFIENKKGCKAFSLSIKNKWVISKNCLYNIKKICRLNYVNIAHGFSLFFIL